MKQLFFINGRIQIEEVIDPTPGPKEVLVRNLFSCFSKGTEMANLTNTKKSVLARVKENPQKVNKILEYAHANGISPAYNFYKAQKQNIEPSGYSCSGIVIGKGRDVIDFEIGDTVCGVGADCAYHAEIVKIPHIMTCKLEAELAREGATVAIWAIALQAVRQMKTEPGTFHLIIGGGLIGYCVSRILSLVGTTAVVIDLNDYRERFSNIPGITFLQSESDGLTEKLNALFPFGFDGACIAASSRSNDILNLCCWLVRRKGNIVITGVVPINIDRRPFYDKELNITSSCSYGFGRYNKQYEKECIDIPIEYVRWTEGRNIKTIVDWFESGRLRFKNEISERGLNDFDNSNLNTNKGLFNLIKYRNNDRAKVVPIPPQKNDHRNNILVIGYSNFAENYRLPAICKFSTKFQRIYIYSKRSEVYPKVKKLFGAHQIEGDIVELIKNLKISHVFLTGNTESNLSILNKIHGLEISILIEKPIARTSGELQIISGIISNTKSTIVCGYNRIYSNSFKYLSPLKYLFMGDGRMIINVINKRKFLGRVNNGDQRDLLMEECCHFLNYANSLVSKQIVSLKIFRGGESSSTNFCVNVLWENGFLAQINYLNQGADNTPKESLQIFQGNETITITNSREIKHIKGRKVFCSTKLPLSDKGWLLETKSFLENDPNNLNLIGPKLLDETERLIVCVESPA